MKDVMTYKGYFATVRYSAESEVFHGKIEAIDDLVSFEGQSVQELKKAFHESVDEYLELCKREGKEPNKTVKGAFNVRIGSELHLRALQEASKEGVSLNNFVKKAIEKELSHTR